MMIETSLADEGFEQSMLSMTTQKGNIIKDCMEKSMLIQAVFQVLLQLRS